MVATFMAAVAFFQLYWYGGGALRALLVQVLVCDNRQNW
jgi:hypothetical protein